MRLVWQLLSQWCADDVDLNTTQTHKSVRRARDALDRPLSLLRCLDAYTRTEVLDDERFCARCSRAPGVDDVQLRKHDIKIELWRVPPIPVVQMKRFQHNEYSHRKLENLVTFDLDGLNVAPFVARAQITQPAPDLSAWRFLGGLLTAETGSSASPSMPARTTKRLFPGTAIGSTERLFEGVPLSLTRDHTVYDLFAVVNHFGALGAGHYVTYARSRADNKWRCFNDSRVSDLDASEVQSSAAYLLFYARRDLSDASIASVFPRVSRGPPADLDKILRGAGASRCSVM